MGNPNASWFHPDKLIKDIIWKDLTVVAPRGYGKLLDVGCGKKPYQMLFSHVSKYIGIDTTSSVAEIRKDFLTARLKSSSFDTVVCTQVLEHVPAPEKLLKKIYFILKPQGILILTAPFVYAIHEEPHDYFRFSRYGLIKILEKSGFTVLTLKEEGNFIVSIATLFASYLEFSFNRYLLRYPKKVLIACFLICMHCLAALPERFSKYSLCPTNYLVVAKKSKIPKGKRRTDFSF